MKRLAFIFIVAALFVFSLASAQEKAMFHASQGFMPDVVTVKATMPDTGRICVEPKGGGLLMCRPISDLRAWIVQPATK